MAASTPAMPSLVSGSVLTTGSGETLVTEVTSKTAVTATSSRALQSRGETFATWVKDRASHGSPVAAYDKYAAARFRAPAPEAASRLSSLDYFDFGAEDARLRSPTAAFSKERRFPRLRQFDTKGRLHGFRRKRVVLHERFHDVDRGRRIQKRRQPYRSHWGLSPERFRGDSPGASSGGGRGGVVSRAPGPGAYAHKDPWIPDQTCGDVPRYATFQSATTVDPFEYKSTWGRPHAGFNTAAALDSPCPYDLPRDERGRGCTSSPPFKAKTHRFDEPKHVVPRTTSLRVDAQGAPVLAVGNVDGRAPRPATKGQLRKARPRTPSGPRPHTVSGVLLHVDDLPGSAMDSAILTG